MLKTDNHSTQIIDKFFQPAIKISHEQNFQSCFIFRGYVMSDNSKIEIYVALHSIDPPENSIV